MKNVINDIESYKNDFMYNNIKLNKIKTEVKYALSLIIIIIIIISWDISRSQEN